VQDSRTAVRFFRKSDAESGNPYGINPDKIGMIGDGSGGYITLASATISDYNDIIVDDLGNPISKFWYNPGTDLTSQW
jgi:acetyl esterase/lipase